MIKGNSNELVLSGNSFFIKASKNNHITFENTTIKNFEPKLFQSSKENNLNITFDNCKIYLTDQDIDLSNYQLNFKNNNVITGSSNSLILPNHNNIKIEANSKLEIQKTIIEIEQEQAIACAEKTSELKLSNSDLFIGCKNLNFPSGKMLISKKSKFSSFEQCSLNWTSEEAIQIKRNSTLKLSEIKINHQTNSLNRNLFWLQNKNSKILTKDNVVINLENNNLDINNGVFVVKNNLKVLSPKKESPELYLIFKNSTLCIKDNATLSTNATVVN